MQSDETQMKIALTEALKAYDEGEIPVGAVLTNEDGILICKNHNRIEQFNDATAHAEILTIREASRILNRRRLSGCTLYVTMEPCPMCAGALILSRISRLVYGLPDSKFGASESLFNITNNPALNHRANITAGVLEEDCRRLMKKFFEERRQK